MTLTDDESDLSETLSSAGSTVPLPSSELGSRAASEDPTSPSGFASSSKTLTKIDRRRKPRFIKPNHINPNHSLPTPNPEKDSKPKKPRLSTRTNDPVDSSSSLPGPDRPIKAESLPPPNLENRFRRNSLSASGTRPVSAKISAFELRPHTSSQQEFTNLSNPLPHPCTSHGHLPLFEQPVLLQGARPRRKPHLMTLNSKKSKKGRKRRGYRLASKSRMPATDQSTINDDSATPTAATFNDAESSLTEQSSSDEASLTDRQVAHSQPSSPSESPSQSLLSINPEPVASASKDSLPDSPNNCAASTSLTKQTSLSHHSSGIPATPVVAQLSSNCHSLPSPGSLSCNLQSTKNLHPNSGHTYSSKNFPNDCAQSQDLSGRCHTNKVNGRNASEESALTPDPEDFRSGTNQASAGNFASTSRNASHHSSLAHDSQSLIDTESHPSALVNVHQLTSKYSPPREFTDDARRSFTGLDHKPRPPNIIPPSTLKSDLSTSTIILDRTVEGNPNSAVFAIDRSPASPLLTSNQHGQHSFLEEHENLSDEALDGEPIADDLMEYEPELCYDEPIREALLDFRQEPSEAGTSAVDGVPVPDSEDVTEDLETQPSLDFQSMPRTCTELDFPRPPHSRPSPQSAREPPEPRKEKLKQSKTLPLEALYEHDDHVRRREDALEAMVKIEIMFAQVRDRLYVERMADVHRETAAVEHGSHPELNEYYQMLQRKRDARLSLAHKIFSLKEIELHRKREAATNSVWTKWHEAKTELHDSMITEKQKQMRQLEREKCQPDLRYNVEVQLLPRPIIPRLNTRKKSRKRARLDLDSESEEMLAIKFHAAIAKRATINLSTLTPEETWADLSVMKPYSRNAHYDPVNIICPPHIVPPYFGDPSECSNELSKKLSSVDNSHMDCCMIGDPVIAGAEKLIALNQKTVPSRSCQTQISSLASPSSSSDLNKPPRRLNGVLNGLSNLHTSSSRTVRNSNRTMSERIEHESSMMQGSSNGQSFKSDRRLTLDSVMASNHTPEKLKGHSKSSNSCSDNVNYTLTTACLGSSPSQINHHYSPSSHQLNRHQTSNIPNNSNRSSLPAQLYPSKPINVNYHERVKTQIA